LLKRLLLECAILAGLALFSFGQTQSAEIRSKVDAVISSAYETATAKFPCKLKSGGDPRMLRWHDVGKCLDSAYDLVDWDDISNRLKEIRKDYGLQSEELMAVVESSLNAQALPYSRVFNVKDVEALLPLSNSLLKFLPEGSLQDLPVFSKSGDRIGTFSGVYSFEKMGTISGAPNQLVLFQYTDPKGNVHGSSERLLLDSFGVPWKGAVSQSGFRLPPNAIQLK